MKLRLPRRTKRTREWRWTTDRRKAEKTQHTPKPATTRSDNRTPHTGIARLTAALPRTPIPEPLNTPARRHTLTAITHIAALELRTTARTRLTWTITATWTALIYGFLLLALATTGTNAPTLLHSITATTTLITTLILAPILGVTPLARTRATGLLDMFRLTGFTPRTISWGTTLATTTQYTLLLLIATPALAIGTLLGNANPLDLTGTLLTLAITGWTLTCLGSATASLIAHRALASFTATTLTGALILTPILLFSALLPLTNEATNAHVATSTPLHATNGHHPEQFITCTVTTATRHRNRPDHIWWLLLPQPFITLADAAPHITHTLAFEPLTALRTAIRTTRTTPPTPPTIDECPLPSRPTEHTKNTPPTPTEKIRATITEQRRTTAQQAEKLTPHWPISLALWALIGTTATAYTTRRLKSPGPAAYGEHTIHHAPTNI